MESIERSALVPYTAAQMFKLVDEAEHYPDFLPWCSGARVRPISEDDLKVTAVLRLDIEAWSGKAKS